MTIARVYAAANGTIRHIFTDNHLTADAGTTLVVRFDIAVFTQIYNLLSSMVKNVRYQDGALVLLLPEGNPATIVNSDWITARNAEVAALETEQADDATARVNLLQLAAAALTQIENDRTAIASGKTAAQNATTLAQMRTIILGMLDVMDNTCNRQTGEIRALRALVRDRTGDG